MPVRLSTSQARNLFLSLQGLADPPQRRITLDGLYDLIVRLGFVQVDSIRTVERAHHLTLFARTTRYRADLLRTLLEQDRRLFENWTHDASIIPTCWYAYWQPRFARERRRMQRSAVWQSRLGPNARQILAQVSRAVQQNGPVMSRDFTDDHTPGMGTWWGWGPSKTALEYLWRTGEFAVSRRINFQKVYDLTERVIAPDYRGATPDRTAYVDWACSTALQRLGMATPGELAAFWAAISPAEARAWCAARVGKTLEAVVVEPENGAPSWLAYAPHDIAERVRHLPAAPSRVRFLSPFDPLIRDRRRTLRLFNFEYRFEAFVPEPRRQYGYYVLPMLERDRFIGRINLKYERRERTLVVKGMWLEAGVRLTGTRQQRIAEELTRYRTFVGAERIVSELA